MKLLELRGLTKHFGGLAAVKNVSFEVSEGEIVGIIGPNGSGKTTLFNLICGFYRPDAGTILFKERNIVGLSPYRIGRMGVGRTFQIVKPFQSMTVLQNVLVAAIFGRPGKTGSEDVKKDCIELLKFTGLQAKRDHFVSGLTIADKKRLELTRALAMKPVLLMLDEVVAGLNPVETEASIELVNKILETGATIIMIEHVMKFIMGISQRIIVLNHGEKIAEGTPSVVAKNPTVIEAYLGAEAVA